ncbi:hypothetical protein [Larkinella arboricola]
MKVLVPIAFFIFFFFSCSSQKNEPLTESKPCRLESIKEEYGVNGSLIQFSYDRDGRLIQQTDSGRVVYESSTSGVFIKNYTYNTNGFLLKLEVVLKTFDVNGREIGIKGRQIETYTYNPEGQLIRNDHFGTGYFMSVENGKADTYEYSGGQLIQATLYGYSEVRIIKFEAGTPIELTSTWAPLNFPSSPNKLFELNEQGYIKSVIAELFGPKNKTAYSYDAKGQQVGSESFDDGLPLERYQHEYDDRKNPYSLIPAFKGFPQYALYGKHLNNRTKSEYRRNAVYAVTNVYYEYNKEGYPTKSREETISSSSPSEPVIRTYTYSQCNQYSCSDGGSTPQPGQDLYRDSLSIEP